MPSLFDRLHKDAPNPLDNIEEILASNDWPFHRLGNNELSVTLSGKYCDYCLIFLWQADMSALQLSVQYDLKILPINLSKATKALAQINENTWMGHFEIPSDACKPHYRYTSLISAANDQILEQIVDIALAQCESNYAAFSVLSADTIANNDTLPLALMQTQGAS